MQADEEGFSRQAEKNGRSGYEYNRVRFYLRQEYDELRSKGGTTPVDSKPEAYVQAIIDAGGSYFDDKDGRRMLRVPAAGRAIYRNVEYVEIQPPGDKTNILDKPVDDELRQRYAKQYAAFKSNVSQDEASGTLLSAWTMDPARAQEYQHVGVKTVEQLAAIPDGVLQKMGPGSIKERERARDFVKTAQGQAPVAELRTENESLKSRMEALEKMVADQKAVIEEHRRARVVDNAFAAAVSQPDPLNAAQIPTPQQNESKRARK